MWVPLSQKPMQSSSDLPPPPGLLSLGLVPGESAKLLLLPLFCAVPPVESWVGSDGDSGAIGCADGAGVPIADLRAGVGGVFVGVGAVRVPSEVDPVEGEVRATGAVVVGPELVPPERAPDEARCADTSGAERAATRREAMQMLRMRIGTSCTVLRVHNRRARFQFLVRCMIAAPARRRCSYSSMSRSLVVNNGSICP